MIAFRTIFLVGTLVLAPSPPAQSRGAGVDWDCPLSAPMVGAHQLHILSPWVLELELITTPSTNAPVFPDWIEARSVFRSAPETGFEVKVDGQPVKVRTVGARRRPVYAPLARYDARIGQYLYLRLAQPVRENETVEVWNPNERWWPRTMRFVAQARLLRYNPAIHVNQEGYVPALPKRAMIGYYLGELGELGVDRAAGFQLVESRIGLPVFQGPLNARPDVGYTYSPAPYRKVLEADFSGFTTPGEDRLLPARERRRHQRRVAGGQMGGGFSGQNAGRRWRLLFPGVSAAAGIRIERVAGPGRSAGGLAQEHGGDGGDRGRVGPVRVLASLQGGVPQRRGSLPAKGPTGLELPDQRHCPPRPGRRVSEADPLWRQLQARR